MTEFTKEFIKGQLEKFHNDTSDEWLTDCWNNYGLALEFIEELYDEIHLHEVWHRTYKDEVTELEAEQRWIPVSEKPKSGEVVLVWNGGLHTAFWFEKPDDLPFGGHWVWHPVRKNMYTFMSGVTHWRHLPHPPKDVK